MLISDLLQGARKDKKLLEAEVLLGFLLGKNREWIIGHCDEEVSSDDLKKFHELWVRLQKGEPLAYLVGEKEFYGIPFHVDERVLVPRPETEALVDLVLGLVDNSARKRAHLRSREVPLGRSDHCAKKNAPKGASNKVVQKVVDVGTGCGAVACAIAVNSPKSRVYATEISEEACEVARKNIKDLGCEVELFCGNLLEPVKGMDFDIIVANLPYIGRERHNFIADNVAQYEPDTALYGGDDGLRLYEELFQQAKNFNPKYILGEFGFLQAEELSDLIKKYFPEAKFEIKQDLSGLDRNFIIRL